VEVSYNFFQQNKEGGGFSCLLLLCKQQLALSAQHKTLASRSMPGLF